MVVRIRSIHTPGEPVLQGTHKTGAVLYRYCKNSACTKGSPPKLSPTTGVKGVLPVQTSGQKSRSHPPSGGAGADSATRIAFEQSTSEHGQGGTACVPKVFE